MIVVYTWWLWCIHDDRDVDHYCCCYCCCCCCCCFWSSCTVEMIVMLIVTAAAAASVFLVLLLCWFISCLANDSNKQRWSWWFWCRWYDVTVVDLAAAAGYSSAPCLLLIWFSRYEDYRFLLRSILTFYLLFSIRYIRFVLFSWVDFVSCGCWIRRWFTGRRHCFFFVSSQYTRLIITRWYKLTARVL